MYRSLQRLIMLLLVVLGVLASNTTVYAQDDCVGVTIRNESSQQLDEQAICDAAQPWVAEGFQVYIFVTDRSFSTEDAWFDLRDQIESAWGIYNPSDDMFAKGALAIEVTTDTSRPWGHDIAFGENLFGTPLDNDSAVGQLEGRLKNRVAEGNLTTAIVETLNEAYAIAYPPPLTNQPLPPGQAEPTPSGLGSALFTLVRIVGLLGLLLGSLYLLFIYAFKPLYSWFATRQQQIEHLNDVARKSGVLLEAASRLFDATAVEDTILWRMFTVYSGPKYPDLSAKVHDWIRQSMVAYQEALLAYRDLDHLEPGARRKDRNELIQAYEMIYITLTGTSKEILNLSEEAFHSFVDPMAPGVDLSQADTGLVEQIRAMREQVREQPLRADLSVVKSEEVDAQGVFGYVNRVKGVIAQLIQAQQEAPQVLENVRQLRASAEAKVVVPDDWTTSDIFAKVDELLSQADLEAEQGRWLLVKEYAANAQTLLTSLADLVPSIAADLADHNKRYHEVLSIAEDGYRLPFLQEMTANCQASIAAMVEAVRHGHLEEARNAQSDLVRQSQELLSAAQALVELRKKNRDSLHRLSQEVADVEAKRVTKVVPAWQRLQTYPSSNWAELAEKFDRATEVLKLLFDDPSDPDDLASRIEHLNSMQVQAFAEAEQELDAAFAALRQASLQLDAIVKRSEEVQTIESQFDTFLAAAEADLNKAVQRRDADDRKIDAEVDQQIRKAQLALEQAAAKGQRRDYMEAATLIAESHRLSNAAHASADQQAKRIDELFARLATVRAEANMSVQAALQAQATLTPAAQTPSTAALCQSTQEALEQAKLQEVQIGAKEDHALAKALEEVVAQYERAQRAAERAHQQVQADAQAYRQIIHAAQATLSEAQHAISAAAMQTSRSDAYGAGSSALAQARRTLPTLPAYGATSESYHRAIAQAQQAQEYANAAYAQASSHIAQVEAAREAERRRRAEEERRRREAAAAAMMMQRAVRTAVTQAARSSSTRSVSRSSSFGSSSVSRSSSMGSSRRR